MTVRPQKVESTGHNIQDIQLKGLNDWMLGVRKRRFWHEMVNPEGRSGLKVKNMSSVWNV